MSPSYDSHITRTSRTGSWERSEAMLFFGRASIALDFTTSFKDAMRGYRVIFVRCDVYVFAE